MEALWATILFSGFALEVIIRQEDIPWDQIAFPTITRTLRFFFDDRRTGLFRTHHIILRKP